MSILFIFPGIYLGWNILGKGFEQSAINHGLCSISALLKSQGYDCFLMDLRSFTGWQHFKDTLINLNFDVVIIGFYSVDQSYADRAIRLIKEHYPDKPVIAGGVHITYNQIKSFSLADCVVWGEGEYVVSHLLNLVKNKKSLPSLISAPIIENLDTLPFIDRGLFNSEYEKNNPIFPLLPIPFYTVNFSRGCPYSCSFCLESKNILWKSYRMRTPESCIEELNTIQKNGERIGSLMIHDDLFPPRSWCDKFIILFRKHCNRIPFFCQMRADWICNNEGLIPDLAKIGLTWVSLGIEGSQKMRDFYNKRLTTDKIIKAAKILHSNKINIFGNYILGSPTETEEDIDELEEIIKVIKPEVHSPSIYTAYPGSKLWDYCVVNNLFVGDGTKEEDHYSLTRFPYERKIKGIDYDFIRKKIGEFTQHRGELKIYG